MLQLINQFVSDSISQGTQTYIITPIINWGIKKGKEVTIKKLTQNIANKLGEKVIGKKGSLNASQEKAHWLRKLSNTICHIPKDIQYLYEGQCLSLMTKGCLSVTNALYPTTVGALLNTVGPKMAKLSRIKCESVEFKKDVVIGAVSQTTSAYMQKCADSTFPQLAPHAGYVAYGVSYGITNLTLNNAYYSVCKVVGNAQYPGWMPRTSRRT